MSVSSDSHTRRAIRRALLILAVMGLAWAGWIGLFGGFDTEPFGIRVRSNDPLRPLILTCVAIVGFVSLGGRVRVPRDAFGDAMWWWPTARGQAIALSLAVTTFGIVYATTVASGSDSYGYVSQAELWLDGDLRIEQSWLAEAPWPSRRWSFAPLGYRALDDDFVIVPTYAAGLAMLLAGAKAIAGQEGMFWVVPLFGGVLVLATYGVARRVAPPGAAVIAAWLIASCPVMLYMLVWPMSDVPVAALWMSACYFLLRPGIPFAGLAGLTAALAVLVRPNLVFIVPVMGIWPVWQAVHARMDRRQAILRAAMFGVCASAGAVVVAVINNYLYGSPAMSGYGDVSAMFDVSHLAPNLVKYTRWLIESQTIAAAAGAVVLVVPWRRLWPEADHRRFLPIAAGIVASVWLSYCLYLEYDAWWFLRFMLPALPFVAIGTATLAVAIRRSGGTATRAVVLLGVLLVVLLQCRYAIDHGVLELWRGERRYVGVGHLVAERTPGNSVIIASQHSGSLRYYGGRVTLRYDNLDGDSLDAAIGWLSSRGIPSYLLVEEWEIPAFRERFAGQASLVRLEMPRVIYRGPATAFLYDMTRTDSGEPPEIVESGEGLRSVRPAPPAQLVLQPPRID